MFCCKIRMGGKNMNESKNVKALKKQLAAAIAMVCVAAVALGSSTYAWFVTNNKVNATTTNISAQSNAAFMTITNGATGASKVDTTSATTTLRKDTDLYPATFGEETNSTKGKFMTGYGTDLDNGTLDGTLKLVGTEGTPDEANTAKYALKEQFNISSKGQNLSDLKVESIETATDAATDQLLKTALRVLVTNSDASKWVVYGLDAAGTKYEIKLSSDTSNANVALGDVTAGADTLVNVYLYYEGKDTNVKTRNLQDGKLDASQSVKINFTATADNQ